MTTQTAAARPAVFIAMALLSLAGIAGANAEETAEPRISTSSQGKAIQRGSVGDGTVTHDEYAPLVTTGVRSKSARGDNEQQKLSAGEARAVNQEFWFYGANVELFSDLDRDGFYTGLDLSFDADTIYEVADVYAVVYLSYELGPWNEYVVTDDFTIFATSGDDEYFIETELVSGYPTGDYDILVELFDTYDGSFVASIGPDDSSALSFLPLEDIGRDTPADTVIVINEGGGSIGWITLLALLAAAAVLRTRSQRAF